MENNYVQQRSAVPTINLNGCRLSLGFDLLMVVLYSVLLGISFTTGFDLRLWICNLIYIFVVMVRFIHTTVQNKTLLFDFSRMRSSIESYKKDKYIELFFGIFHVIMSILITVSLTENTPKLPLMIISYITLILGYGKVAMIVLVIFSLFATIMAKACMSRNINIIQHVMHITNNPIDAVQTVVNSGRVTKVVREEELGKSSESSCCVCRCNYPSTKCKPCNHYAMCLECAQLLSKCPLCRQSITELHTTGESKEIQSDDESEDNNL